MSRRIRICVWDGKHEEEDSKVGAAKSEFDATEPKHVQIDAPWVKTYEDGDAVWIAPDGPGQSSQPQEKEK